MCALFYIPEEVCFVVVTVGFVLLFFTLAVMFSMKSNRKYCSGCIEEGCRFRLLVH